jgi:hypothetical protein
MCLLRRIRTDHYFGDRCYFKLPKNQALSNYHRLMRLVGHKTAGLKMCLLYCCMTFFFLITNCSTYNTSEHYKWPDLNQPLFRTIAIPLYGDAIIDVNVQEALLQQSNTITIRISMGTPFQVTNPTMGTSSGFNGFNPKIAVNGSRFTGVYPIRFMINENENQINAYVKIKTEHLKPGLNNLSFDAGKESNIRYACSGDQYNCDAIYIKKMWIER